MADFNPIDSRTQISTITGDERVPLSANTDTGGVGPGATDRKTTLNKIKDWIAIAIEFLKIDFTAQTTIQQPYLKGRFFYDSDADQFVGYNSDILTGTAILGEQLMFTGTNDEAFGLVAGDVVKITGLLTNKPSIKLAQANTLIDARTTLGMVKAPIVAGAKGKVAVFDVVSNVDTSGMDVNDIIYLDPDNAGKFTNVAPMLPNYILPIGFVSIVDAVVGVVGVRFSGYSGNDTSVNLDGTLNGLITQTPDVTFSVSGGIIYADVINEYYPTENLPFVIGGVRYLLNTTTNTGTGGAARIIVPPGNLPSVGDGGQKSWLYVKPNGGNPVLGISTSKPSVTNAGVSTQVLYDAATTLSRGKPQAYRRENNASNSETEGISGSYGFTRVQADDARSRGSAWDSGQDPTTTVNDTTIQIAMSAGIGKQLHYAGVPIFDGLLYQVYNDSTNAITNEEETNLFNILLDANGQSLLGNGFYYTIRIYYKLNSNGIGNDIIATRPQGHYGTGALAEADALKYTTILADTGIEDIVYPLYDLVIEKTGGGGATTTLYSITSLRSKVPGVAGGTGGEGVTTDDKTRISAADTVNDYLNPKIAEGSGIVTTILNPGANEQLEISVPLAGTGVANGGVSNVAQDIYGLKPATGTSAIDGTDPVKIRIKDLRDATGWTVGAEMMAYEFYSSDTSGTGLGVKARISAIVENSTASLVGLGFVVKKDGVALELVGKFNNTGKLELLVTPTENTKSLPPVVWDETSKELQTSNQAYTVLTVAAGAAAYALNTGMNKTATIIEATTITFTQMAIAAKNPYGAIVLNVTVQSDVILAGAGVTFKGVGSLTALPIGEYIFAFTVVSATKILWNIDSSNPYV